MTGPVALTTTATSVAVAPSGELDLDRCNALRAALRAAADTGLPVCLDLSAVTFMDSSALGVILSARNLLRTRGQQLAITGTSARVMTVLRLTGLLALINAGAPTDTESPAWR